MICKSLDDDPGFKVNRAFNGGNIQVYHTIFKLINLTVGLGNIDRNVQAMYDILLIPVDIRWNYQ